MRRAKAKGRNVRNEEGKQGKGEAVEDKRREKERRGDKGRRENKKRRKKEWGKK